MRGTCRNRPRKGRSACVSVKRASRSIPSPGIGQIEGTSASSTPRPCVSSPASVRDLHAATIASTLHLTRIGISAMATSTSGARRLLRALARTHGFLLHVMFSSASDRMTSFFSSSMHAVSASAFDIQFGASATPRALVCAIGMEAIARAGHAVVAAKGPCVRGRTALRQSQQQYHSPRRRQVITGIACRHSNRETSTRRRWPSKLLPRSANTDGITCLKTSPSSLETQPSQRN